ncbi:MAG: LmbE family N-acetylglucosaminyl deacetylase [Desulforhopalus sp.]|jgi:LmbE family N-acetylglucosaminyl deacetylase
MKKTILVLAPHTDDGEFGCGGAIAKNISEGHNVIYVAFSAAEQSVLPHLPKDILRTEVREATSKLGIDDQNCIVLDFEVRRFPEVRQSILDKMIELNKEFCPDLIFLPSTNDTHQDHQTIAQEGFRAFKRSSMLGYEVPWNNLDFRTSCFIELKTEYLYKKTEALAMYKSQRHRDYASKKFIESLAITRGVQIGKKYAESFEVVRWVIN